MAKVRVPSSGGMLYGAQQMLSAPVPSAQVLSPHGGVRKSHIQWCSQRLSHTTAMPIYSQIWGEPGSALSIPSQTQAEEGLPFFPRGVTEWSLWAEWLCEAEVVYCILRTASIRREGQEVCCSLQSLSEMQLPEEHSRGRDATSVCLSACLQGAGLMVALSPVSFRRGRLEGHHEVRSGVQRTTQPLQVFRLRQRATSHPALTGHYYSCPWGQDLPVKGLSFY